MNKIFNQSVSIVLTALMLVGVLPFMSLQETYAASKAKTTWTRVKKIKKDVEKGTVRFTIKKIKGAKKYKIYIKEDKKSWKLIKTQKKRSFNTSVESGRKYKFRVKAIGKKMKKLSCKAYSVDMRTKAQKIPKKPTGLKICFNSQCYSSGDCDWYYSGVYPNEVGIYGFQSKSDSSYKYEIEFRSENSGWSKVKTLDMDDLTKGILVYKGIAKAGTYSYRVRAVNKYGKSPWSDILMYKVDEWEICEPLFILEGKQNVLKFMSENNVPSQARRLVINNSYLGDYPITKTQADRYIKNIKETVEETTKGLTTDKEKVMAFQKWRMEHIPYNANNPYKQLPVRAFDHPEDGLACGGFALLICDLCRAAGIPALCIKYPGSPYHACNAIYADGSWYSFDSTAGAGASLEKFVDWPELKQDTLIRSRI